MSAHKFCTHPATKSARAACRRDSKNFPGTKLAAPDAGSYAFQDEMDAEMRRTAVYVDDSHTSRLERELAEYDENPGQMPKTHVVTRSTWKGYRNFNVVISVTVWGAQPDTEFHGKIVAWGEKRFSYVSSTGARNTIDADRVKSVSAILDRV